MAFPQVEGTQESNGSSSGGFAPTLPSGIVTGERLLAVVAFDTLTTNDPVTMSHTGTGWVELGELRADGNVLAGVFEKREADGSDALTVSISGNTVGELATAVVRRISGHDATQAGELASAANPSGTPDVSPDAPNLAPSWGSADTLWVWAAAWDNATRTISAYPSSYSANQVAAYGAASSAAAAVASATRELAASSENPGAATISVAEQWVAFTIAIRGTGGGSTPIEFTGTIPTLNGTEGSAFSENLSSYFSGTETPFSYAVQSGTLPAGLTLNSSTGAISGTPTTAGTASGIVIRGTDDAADTADSNSFSIVIAAAPTGPTIDTQPSNQTVTEGATATFAVAATTSGGSLSYQWQRNPGGVGSWANVTTGTGGTSASYTTAATTVSGGDANNTDTWRCNVTDDNGTTTSSAATLTVNAASTSDIRLAIGIDWEEGGEFASQTVRHWSVWSLDGATMQHSGTTGTTSSGGVLTIDIDDSAFTVGDDCLFYVLFHDNATDPLDRTVRTVAGYITTTAQA